MEGNPYSGMVEMMYSAARKHDSSAFLLGKVKTEKPLSVLIGDNVIAEEEKLKVNAALLPGMEQKYNAQIIGGSMNLGEESGTPSGTIQFTSQLEETPLKEGDQVLLLSEDMQVFYLICKVVDAQ